MGNDADGYTLVEVGGIDEDSTKSANHAYWNGNITIRGKLFTWIRRLDAISDRDARNEAIAEEEEELGQEQINEIEDAPSIVDDGSVTNLSLMPTNSLYVPSYKSKKNEMKDKAQLQKEQAYTESEIEAEVGRQKAAKEEANAENEQSKNDDVEQVSVGDTCCIYHYVLKSTHYSYL